MQFPENEVRCNALHHIRNTWPGWFLHTWHVNDFFSNCSNGIFYSGRPLSKAVVFPDLLPFTISLVLSWLTVADLQYWVREIINSATVGSSVVSTNSHCALWYWSSFFWNMKNRVPLVYCVWQINSIIIFNSFLIKPPSLKNAFGALYNSSR